MRQEPRLPGRHCLDQADYGHPAPYEDYTRWPNYYKVGEPYYGYTIHWQGYGSIGSESYATTALAKKSALAIRRYHVEVRGWWDAAYAAFAWFPMLRFRGSNHNGAQKDSNFFGGRTYPVLFPTGTSYPIPHKRSLKGFAYMWAENPAPVTGHGLLPMSPSGVKQDTQCPGPWLRNYIVTQGWLDLLADGTQGERFSWQTSQLKRRLNQLGYWTGRYSRHYSNPLRVAVKLFQADHGLPATGLAGRATWQTLGR